MKIFRFALSLALLIASLPAFAQVKSYTADQFRTNAQASTPSTPSSGGVIYQASDGSFHVLNSAGVNIAITADTLAALSGMTQGAILYHNGTSWTYLAPGTSGQYLKTGGAGANPSWADVTAGVASVFGKTGTVANISDGAGYLHNDGSGHFTWGSPAGSGDVTGPASSVAGNLPSFGGITGKELIDSGVSADSVSTHIADTSNPHGVTAAQAGAIASSDLDTDNTMAADSDSKVASQKAVKYYIDNHGGSADNTARGDGTWTSITSSPSQRAVEEALSDVGVEYASRASNLASTDHGKLHMAYHTGVPASIDSYAKLCLHFDGNITDSSASAHTITDTSTTSDTTNKKFGSASRAFNGTSAYLEAADSDDWNFDGDFTIDWWMICTADGGRMQTIAAHGGDGGTNLGWELFTYNDTDMRFYYSTDGSSGPYVTFSSVSPTSSSFVHWALVRTGSTLKLFKNGTQAGGDQTVSGSFYNSTCPLRVGYYSGSAALHFKGNIDEFRISKGVARWTAAFTPPTAAYTSDSTLVSKHTLVPISWDRMIDNGVCDLRLTLVSGAPVMTSDAIGATTLYAALYKGNRVALYDTATSSLYGYTTAELPASMSSLAASTVYDVFIRNTGTISSPSLALEFSPWLVSTNSSSVRARELKSLSGVYVKDVISNLSGYTNISTYVNGSYYSGSSVKGGQTFNLAADATITGCQFLIAKNGAPTGNVAAELYACSGTPGSAAVATGSALATSAAVDISTLSTAYSMVDFAFTGGYSATAGNYVIVVSYSGGDASNYLKAAMDGTHLGHAGNFAYYNSSTWTANNARDMIFKIYTTVTDATSYNGRYLGTIMTTSTAGQCEVSFGRTAATGGSAPKCLLWNAQNRVLGGFTSLDSTASWTYTTATWRQKNGSAGNQFSFITGLPAEVIYASGTSLNANATAGVSRYSALGLNGTAPYGIYPSATTTTAMSSFLTLQPAVGYNYLAELEWSAATGTTTWYGTTFSGGIYNYWY